MQLLMHHASQEPNVLFPFIIELVTSFKPLFSKLKLNQSFEPKLLHDVALSQIKMYQRVLSTVWTISD